MWLPYGCWGMIQNSFDTKGYKFMPECCGDDEACPWGSGIKWNSEWKLTVECDTTADLMLQSGALTNFLEMNTLVEYQAYLFLCWSISRLYLKFSFHSIHLMAKDATTVICSICHHAHWLQSFKCLWFRGNFAFYRVLSRLSSAGKTWHLTSSQP